jgi:hypothetical protein
MPALLAPFVGFILGVLFAWAAHEELLRASGSLLSTRAIAIVVLFAFLVYGPFAGYFVTYATDWSFAYLFDSRRVPSAMLLLLVLLDIASVPIGFGAAANHARQRRINKLLPLVAVPLALAAVVLAITSQRLSMYGSYAQVHRGINISPLAGSPIGYAILWFLGCLTAAFFWTTRELRQFIKPTVKSTKTPVPLTLGKRDTK